MSANGESASAALRKLGTDFYKQNKLDQAVVQYKLAAESDKSDPAPLSNLSATYYELGNYNTSADTTLEALGLIQVHDLERRQKLNPRLARCYIHLRQVDKAEAALENMPSADRDVLLESLTSVSSINVSSDDVDAARAKVINHLPRCKPSLQQVPEYYTVGHDVPTSLTDSKIYDNYIRNKEKVSLFFGGIGDARNMYATLLDMMLNEKCQTEQTAMPEIHITINDLKAPAIARDLVVLFILHEMAEFISGHGEMDEHQRVVATLYYVYLSPVMPPCMYDILQVRITRVIDALEERGSFPPWLDVPEIYRPSLLHALGRWQTETAVAYPTSRVRRVAVDGLLDSRIQQDIQLGSLLAKQNRFCRMEEDFYFKTGVLVLSEPSGGAEDLPEIEHASKVRHTFQEFHISKGTSPIDQKALQEVDQFWKPNVTLIDLEWERNRDDRPRFPGAQVEPDLAHNPFDFLESLNNMGYTKNQKGGFNIFQMFFVLTAHAMNDLKGRLRIEAIPGDVTTVLEQIRYGLVGHRQVTDATAETSTKSMSRGHPKSSGSEYPHMYHRIHLSNIPDYIGGNMSSFLYAIPVTHVGDDAYITSTCLRNPPKFRSMSYFNNEYLALSSVSDLESAFQTRLGDHDTSGYMPLAQYANWHHSQSKPQSFAKLIPRARLETWLYRVFFKIAIPLPRQVIDFQLIYSPLNLTVFFRLIQRLGEAGYPFHWLSQVLANILSGSVTTRARSPKSNPLRLREVKEEIQNPSLAQSTGPFVAEMSMLAAIWFSFLPFGLVGGGISPARDVKKYEIKLPRTNGAGAGHINCFVLVFIDDDIFEPIPLAKKADMWRLILSDETGARGAPERMLRQSGMHIVSTWDWNKESKTASFWMLSGVVSKMGKEWSVRIIRTDDWSPASDHVLLREGLVDTGEKWSS